MITPQLDRMSDILLDTAPYMHGIINKCRQLFGEPWRVDFERNLTCLFGEDENLLRQAVKGYVSFSLESLLLQKKFEKTGHYSLSDYSNAYQTVYDNTDYMLLNYLPGNLLLHFLWPHHYRQLLFFREFFIPEIKSASTAADFCDIGVGSGFYSRLLLESCPQAQGWGFDISRHSLAYAQAQIERFGMASRWRGTLQDITETSPNRQWDFATSVEILEHIENPVCFLKAIRERLRLGGKAFISAAITADQSDHIYLYNESCEVEEHLSMAGFTVLERDTFEAFESPNGGPVPRLGVFIVQ